MSQPAGQTREPERLSGRAELLILDVGSGGVFPLPDGRSETVQLLRLCTGGRGLEQIADHLSSRRDVAGLRILSGAVPGALLLAGERVDLPALAMRPGVLAEISAALAGHATVTICARSVAQGPEGRQFMDYLQAALGVPVVVPKAVDGTSTWRSPPGRQWSATG